MKETTTLNICAGAGCPANCIHLTHVQDGKIVKVEGCTYPDGKKGFICQKGLAGARLPYHPDRLKYPLKRAGKRGEGKWQRITWEQALDEIADKLKRIREQYRPESVAMVPYYNAVIPKGGIQPLLGRRLENLLQATDLFRGQGIDSNPAFSDYFSLGATWGSSAHPQTLIEGNTKYMIVWGGNPAEMAPRFMTYVSKAQRRGAKLVDIGLVFDPTAQKADWWIPVQAGSDGALALAMISVIMNEKLYDGEYVTRYTNAPFLVRMDNSKFLRESDTRAGGDPQKYVAWDTASGQPRAIAPKTSGLSGFEPALFGAYKPGGIECKPVFQMLADLANQHPPQKVEETTGVSSETIEKLARGFATTKPAAILQRLALRYKNSGNAYRATAALAAITGNIGVLGGGIITSGATEGRSPFLRFDDSAIMFPTQARAVAIPIEHSFERIKTGKPYPIKALVIYGMNAVHTYPNPRRWFEDVFPNLDLIVVNEIFMTATAEYADYVLPDCTVFERDEIEGGDNGHIVLLEKAIEPMYECRPPIYFWSELARRLGFGEYFDKNIDEWMEFRLSTKDPSVAGIQPPLTLERLKKEKMVRANVPGGISHPFLDKKFRTPSGKIELYCEELVPAGDGLPVFREQLESPRSALAKKYPLIFNTANNRFFVHSMFSNDALTLKSYKKEPHISINPDDAKKRGIKDGDIVLVYNDRGSCKVKATVSETMPSGVVQLPHGWWPKQFIEGHLANLLLSQASPETKDMARVIWWSLVAERSGIEGLLALHGMGLHTPDTLFDCLCEVRRL